MTDNDILADIVKSEGSKYTNDPADKGGPTKYGITLGTLSAWRKYACAPADVENLSEMEALAIYRSRYVVVPGFNAIADDRLRWVVVDCGVLHGPGNAVRFLQRALGVEDDGVFGPLTRDALAKADAAALFRRVNAERLRFLGRLISKDLADADKDGIPDNTEFAAGWLNRIARFVEAA